MRASLTCSRGEAPPSWCEKSPSKRCEFGDTGFSSRDAQKLAKLWKTSVTDAKSRGERKASTGDASVAQELLKRR